MCTLVNAPGALFYAISHIQDVLFLALLFLSRFFDEVRWLFYIAYTWVFACILSKKKKTF